MTVHGPGTRRGRPKASQHRLRNFKDLGLTVRMPLDDRANLERLSRQLGVPMNTIAVLAIQAFLESALTGIPN